MRNVSAHPMPFALCPMPIRALNLAIKCVYSSRGGGAHGVIEGGKRHFIKTFNQMTYILLNNLTICIFVVYFILGDLTGDK